VIPTNPSYVPTGTSKLCSQLLEIAEILSHKIWAVKRPYHNPIYRWYPLNTLVGPFPLSVLAVVSGLWSFTLYYESTPTEQ